MLAAAGTEVDTIRDLIRTGRFQDAIARCEAALRSSPTPAPYWTLKGLALRGAGDTIGAANAWERAGGYRPALQALAQIRFDSRDPAAKSTLERLLRANPASQEARAMLGTLTFESRDCEATVRTLTPITTPSPAIRWQLGVCQFELQRYSLAATQFTALLKLREHAPTRYNLALAHWHGRDYRATSAVLAQATDADSLRLLAAARQSDGDVAGALAVLRMGVDAFPDDERFVVDLAVLCFDQGDYDLGAEVAEAGVQRHPASTQLPVLLGTLQVRAGQLDKGEATLRGVEQSSPLGRIGLASLLMQLGLAGEAANLLNSAAHSQPPDDRAIVTWARAVLRTSSPPASVLPLLEGTVSRDARNAAAHALLGKLYARRGSIPAAIRVLRTAITLDPSDRASTYQLMLLYRKQGEVQAAAQMSSLFQAMTRAAQEEESSRFRLVRTVE